MDYYWAGEWMDSVKVYNTEAFFYALVIIPVAATLGSMMLLVVRYKAAKRST